jgi:hypothetical protein
MQDKMLVRHMGVLVQVVNPRRVKAGRPPLDAMDFVAFLEQEFGQVGAILAGYAGDQGCFHKVLYIPYLCSILKRQAMAEARAIFADKFLNGTE